MAKHIQQGATTIEGDLTFETGSITLSNGNFHVAGATTLSGVTTYAQQLQINMPGSGIILKDANGQRWGLYVATDGILTTVQV